MKINFPLGKQHVEIISKTIPVNYHTVFLDENIVEPAEYRELISLLLNSSELDTIDIVINSGGGRLDAARAIIESIKACAGSVKATIVGECHSAASMIALNCPEVVVLDSAQMMIHEASWGVIGKGSNNKSQNDFIHRTTEKLVRETYGGFLTAKEIEQVLSGVEMWFDADEIHERVIKLKKYREQAQKKKGA